MKIKIFEVGPFLENTYLLEQNGEAILFDPGFSSTSEYQQFVNYLDSSGSSLIAILLTHAHVDHVLGLQQVLKDFEVPVYLNTEDLFLWENFGNQATMFGLRQVGFSFIPNHYLWMILRNWFIFFRMLIYSGTFTRSHHFLSKK